MKTPKFREAVPAAFVLVAFGIGVIASPHFLDFGNLLDSSSLYVETGLLALGMTLVIVCGHIDLSVGSALALVACATAKLVAAGWSPFTAIAAGLLLGALLGWINGMIVSKLKLPSFAVTLATMAAYRGMAQVLVGSNSVKAPNSLTGIDFVRLPHTPIPLPLVILVVIAILIGLTLARTVVGRWIYANGTNERAAYFSGVPTGRVTTTAFVLSGLLAGIAGLIMTSRLGVARFDHGLGLELDAITAVVLGGASIYGGSGSILGTVLALLSIAFLRIGMGLANVTAEYQMAAIGALLIVSVGISAVIENWTNRRRPLTPHV